MVLGFEKKKGWEQSKIEKVQPGFITKILSVAQNKTTLK